MEVSKTPISYPICIKIFSHICKFGAERFKAGIVTKAQGQYSLTDPLLRIFINELYSTSEL